MASIASKQLSALVLTSSAADGAASRAALYALLGQLGASIERSVDDAKFNAVPGPQARARKRKGGTEDEVAARRAADQGARQLVVVHEEPLDQTDGGRHKKKH